ncbi:iron complex outermembrane receptor protein [Dysgonomonas sp. PFB1-18]|uniref:TonB-dependent receptor n=1 Tax=unclassified Dysgonomonas TaxID=2630389 RepID=UPI0024767245|nr:MULTISPECIES: TonB-dependent receptor [unclassified Dysgonomonas]MDH6309095.1 iron complex outermembrane receptor protein [Dysgonomonas sp. PF1-14]MDH6339025.1 iron complex outermembrane receptor protein [Dysgonomonas sp. PF1-16]MDH6380344.1 iron complex outermembrane receptor protein [Dysgonomonas sp. PFB1-18]MDH6397853.1 iron complex outermembrane receptor protein [Dysgonomonas sp. PF1-23]
MFKNRLLGIVIVLLLFSVAKLSAQSSCSLSGTVKDAENGKAIAGASVSVQNTTVGEITDSLGFFSFCHLEEKEYVLYIDFIGYKKDSVKVDLSKDITHVDIRLIPADIALNEVFVDVNTSSVARTVIYRGPLLDKPVTSFAQTLNIVPGATAMSIGAGTAKPVVRGLGFNRVAVINRGIIQQNQQWGADHGMEIGQFDVYEATIHKGPDALLSGSSATTAIEIEPYGFKDKSKYFGGEAVLMGASNNDMLGGALIAEWQKGNWYARGSYSYRDYADYRVPADYFIYEEEKMPLPDKRVPNTAGREQSVSGTLGFRKNNITTYLNISNNYQKNGLFELSHDHDDHDHEGEDADHDHDSETDTSHRNIGLPYSTSNHFVITNNTEWKKDKNTKLEASTAFQSNHRREFEHFHEHYEGQAVPATDDDLAVDFRLRTYSTNIRLSLGMQNKWKNNFSTNVEYQQNRIGGFEYFLPRYNQVSGGIAYTSGYEISDKWLLLGGVRYDAGHMDITGFYDEALASHLKEEGYGAQLIQDYAQRAYNVNRNFGGVSGSVGVRYRPINDLTVKLNLGKSYRMPSANELGANGLHHAAFRYEIGNPDLASEHGYTMNLDIDLSRDITGLDGRYHPLQVSLYPFVYYYSNYIFLQAVDNSSVQLYEQQPYKYSQAKAIYGGGEYQVKWRMIEKLELSTNGSLVLNKNLDDHEPLPFTPPFTMTNGVMFLNNNISRKKISYYQISATHRLFADQNRVGAGEEKTTGANLFDLSAGIVYKINSKLSIDVNMQVLNIFDKRYLNHMSLYRRINIPEQGRNFQLFLRIPFST